MVGTQLRNIVRALASRRDALSDESGQAFIFAVVMISVVLVIGAIVIDAGLAFSEKDNVQTATDAAVLAGAHKLPDQSLAKIAACDYLARNGYSNTCVLNADPCPSDTNCVNVPPTKGAHVGDTGYIEVIGQSSSSGGFINIFASVGALKPSARSVAGYTTGGSVSAGVYAYVTNPQTTNCQPPKVAHPGKDVEFSGGTTTINGDLRSNGSIYANGLAMNGGTVTFGCNIGEYPVCAVVCDPAVQDTNQSAYPPPIPLTTSGGLFVSTDLQNVCATHPANVYVMSSGDPIATAHDQNNIVHYHAGTSGRRSTLDPGIYCVTGHIKIPNNLCARAAGAGINTCYIPDPAGSLPSVGNGITFIALGPNGWVDSTAGIGGTCSTAPNGGCSVLPAFSSSTLNPLNVLIYAEATGGGQNNSTIHPGCGTNGKSYLYTGILAAPNGQINGGGLCTFWGGWMADTIKITGGGIIINASGIGGVGGSPVITLVE